MIDRAALLTLAQALPDGAAVPVPRAWLLELLEPAGEREPIKPTLEVDLTPEEVAVALHRSPVTVRSWCNAGAFPTAYRMRGRQWRIPRRALDAFQAAERRAHVARRGSA